MLYVKLNQNGERVSCGYDRAEDIPKDINGDVFLFSDAEYEKLLNGYIFQGGEFKEKPPHVPTLDELKPAKLSEVDSWTASKITGGFISSCSGEPVRYDSDKDTQLTMQGIALNVGSEQFAQQYPDGCPVRGYAVGQDAKSVFMLTPEQVLSWQADLSAHIGTCKQAGWAKQAEVEAAVSKEELESITFNEGSK